MRKLLAVLALLSFTLSASAGVPKAKLEEFNTKLNKTVFIVNAGGICAGSLIDKKKRLVLTAAHCLILGVFTKKPPRDITVQSGPLKFPVHVVKWDEDTDLMLMQIDAPLPKSFTEELSVLPSKEKVYRFQTVFTVGHPHGWGNSGAEGIVSHPNRTQGKFKADQIQIDMAINGGNSGGPLLDEDLNLIGVVSWGEFGGVEENPSQININFAISYKTINKFLEGV